MIRTLSVGRGGPPTEIRNRAPRVKRLTAGGGTLVRAGGASLRKIKPISERLLELDADADAGSIEMDFEILHREELDVVPLGAQEHIRQHEESKPSPAVDP